MQDTRTPNGVATLSKEEHRPETEGQRQLERPLMTTQMSLDTLAATAAEHAYFDWVPIEKMFIDDYGRAVSPRKVENLRKGWNLLKVGSIYLSKRDNGRYAVLDGGHRRQAAILEGEEALPARVYVGLTYEQEALLYKAFATVNRQNARDRFRAALAAREREAVEIEEILHRHGLKPGLDSGTMKGGRVQALFSLEEVARNHGLDMVNEVIATLSDAWGHHPRAYVAPAITGLALFIARYRGRYKRTRLIDRMQAAGPDEILQRMAIFRRASPAAVGGAWGQALRLTYNWKLSSAGELPEWVSRNYSDETKAAMPARSRKGWRARKQKLAEEASA